MTPRTYGLLVDINNANRRHGRTLRRAAKALESAAEDLPAAIAPLRSRLAAMQDTHDSFVEELLKHLLEDETPKEPAPLTPAQARQLLDLNQKLCVVTRQLRSVLDEVKPGLDTKLGDPSDAMYDYEIDARISYHAHEDDPENFDGDDQLTRSSFSLKHEPDWKQMDQRYPNCPPLLLAEPLCRLFCDLYRNDYGHGFHNLTLRDCLRLDSIHVNVRVLYQYSFDANPKR